MVEDRTISEQFDGYHKWLGIPPEEQPPTHYRLLGLRDFESDVDVIDTAAEQRMQHLRTCQTGKHAELSQKLLNEIASARLTLLDLERKSAYDAILKQQQEVATDAVDRSPNHSFGEPKLTESVEPLTTSTISPVRRTRKKPKWVLPVGVSTAALVILVLVIVIATSNTDKPGQSVVEKKNPPSQADKKQNGSTPNDNADTAKAEPMAPTVTDDGSQSSRTANNNETANPTDNNSTPNSNDTGGNHAAISNTDSPETRDGDDAPTDAVTLDGTPSVATSKKLSVPTDEQQKPALAALRKTFDLSTERTSEQKLALARQLFKVAGDTTEPVEKFVVLRGTTNFAAQGGDAELMMQAVDQIDRHFEIDRLEIGHKALMGFAGSAENEDAIASLAEATAKFVDEAVAADRVDLAKQLAHTVYDVMVRKRFAAKLRKQIYDRRNQVDELFSRWKKVQDALAVLKSKPDDSSANLTVGKWYCFEKNDWEQGLPFLANSNDKLLSPFAQDEVNTPPTSTAEQVKLADAWWAAAEATAESEQPFLKQRAVHWYKLAEPNVTSSLDKARIEKRLRPAKEHYLRSENLGNVRFLDWRNNTWENDIRTRFAIRRVNKGYQLACDTDGYKDKLVLFSNENVFTRRLFVSFRIESGSIRIGFRPPDLAPRAALVDHVFETNIDYTVELWIERSVAKALVNGKPVKVEHKPDDYGFFALIPSRSCLILINELSFHNNLDG